MILFISDFECQNNGGKDESDAVCDNERNISDKKPVNEPKKDAEIHDQIHF